MIRFAAMLARLPQDRAALDAYLQAASGADRAAAEALLSGHRPVRIAGLTAILHWAAEVAAVPDWLMEASLAASGDKAETAALLLADGRGQPPGLAEVVDRLNRCTRITAHATLVELWARLPPAANLVLNRLASGTFRTIVLTEAAVLAQPAGPRRVLRAVMVQAQATRAEVTLALWHGNALVPIARLPLTLAETPEIMSWIRANVSERFGPVRLVPPVHLFEIGFDGLSPNPRRKCGFDLLGATITRWLPDQGSSADHLDTLNMAP
jgi:hypothetical protein